MEASSISWLLDEEENITVVDKSTAFLRKHNAEINKSPLKTEKRPVTAFTFRNLVDALRGCLTSDESDDVGIDNVLGGTPGAAQLHKLASKTVVRWRTISDDFVTRLRKSETRTFVHAGTLLQRSAGARSCGEEPCDALLLLWDALLRSFVLLCVALSPSSPLPPRPAQARLSARFS